MRLYLFLTPILTSFPRSGKSATAKLADLHTFLTSTYPSPPSSSSSSQAPTSPPSFLLTSLNPLAWFLNLRTTGDIAFNPVFYGYLLVRPAPGPGSDTKEEEESKRGRKQVVLWVQKEAVTEEVRRRVEDDLEGEIREYEEAEGDLKRLAEVEGERVVGDGKVSFALANAIGVRLLLLVSFLFFFLYKAEC